MILNLETEKAVDSSKRLGIVSGYSQLRPALSILGFICVALHLNRGLSGSAVYDLSTVRQFAPFLRKLPPDFEARNAVGDCPAISRKTRLKCVSDWKPTL
jgi:hypothetical protein